VTSLTLYEPFDVEIMSTAVHKHSLKKCERYKTFSIDDTFGWGYQKIKLVADPGSRFDRSSIEEKIQSESRVILEQAKVKLKVQ